jgi:hypothetical protein
VRNFGGTFGKLLRINRFGFPGFRFPPCALVTIPPSPPRARIATLLTGLEFRPAVRAPSHLFPSQHFLKADLLLVCGINLLSQTYINRRGQDGFLEVATPLPLLDTTLRPRLKVRAGAAILLTAGTSAPTKKAAAVAVVIVGTAGHTHCRVAVAPDKFLQRYPAPSFHRLSHNKDSFL